MPTQICPRVIYSWTDHGGAVCGRSHQRRRTARASVVSGLTYSRSLKFTSQVNSTHDSLTHARTARPSDRTRSTADNLSNVQKRNETGWPSVQCHVSSVRCPMSDVVRYEVTSVDKPTEYVTLFRHSSHIIFIYLSLSLSLSLSLTLSLSLSLWTNSMVTKGWREINAHKHTATAQISPFSHFSAWRKRAVLWSKRHCMMRGVV